MGGWGRSWANLLAQQDALVHTVAYVDVNPAMLRQLQRDLGVVEAACFSALDAALAANDADAVLVTTALAGHVPVVLQALAAGKHVLMEKPVERDTAAARALVALAREGGITLGVVFQHRFREGSERLRRLLADGGLGHLAGHRLAGNGGGFRSLRGGGLRRLSRLLLRGLRLRLGLLGMCRNKGQRQRDDRRRQAKPGHERVEFHQLSP